MKSGVIIGLLLFAAPLLLAAATAQAQTTDECQYTAWSTWSPCSSFCAGTQTRARSVTFKPAGVTDCPGALIEQRACGMPTCDCSMFHYKEACNPAQCTWCNCLCYRSPAPSGVNCDPNTYCPTPAPPPPTPPPPTPAPAPSLPPSPPSPSYAPSECMNSAICSSADGNAGQCSLNYFRSQPINAIAETYFNCVDNSGSCCVDPCNFKTNAQTCLSLVDPQSGTSRCVYMPTSRSSYACMSRDKLCALNTEAGCTASRICSWDSIMGSCSLKTTYVSLTLHKKKSQQQTTAGSTKHQQQQQRQDEGEHSSPSSARKALTLADDECAVFHTAANCTASTTQSPPRMCIWTGGGACITDPCMSYSDNNNTCLGEGCVYVPWSTQARCFSSGLVCSVLGGGGTTQQYCSKVPFCSVTQAGGGGDTTICGAVAAAKSAPAGGNSAASNTNPPAAASDANLAAIIGGIAGGLVLVGAVVVLVIFLMKGGSAALDGGGLDGRKWVRNAWNVSLFGCFDDFGTLCGVFWCLPCYIGWIANNVKPDHPEKEKSLDLVCCLGSCCCSACVPCFVCRQRGAAQDYLGISSEEEGCLCGALKPCCCPACSTCQIANELKVRHKWLGAICSDAVTSAPRTLKFPAGGMDQLDEELLPADSKQQKQQKQPQQQHQQMQKQLQPIAKNVTAAATPNKTPNNNNSVLFAAIRNGDLAGFKDQLAVTLSGGGGANNQVIDNEGRSLLHLCVFHDKTELAKHLIDETSQRSGGGEVLNLNLLNARDSKNQTPLHQACFNGKLAFAQMLVTAGADINSTNSNGSTPLHFAASNGHLPIVSFLCGQGAKVVQNKAGKTPADLALSKEFPEIAELVKKHEEERLGATAAVPSATEPTIEPVAVAQSTTTSLDVQPATFSPTAADSS